MTPIQSKSIGKRSPSTSKRATERRKRKEWGISNELDGHELVAEYLRWQSYRESPGRMTKKEAIENFLGSMYLNVIDNPRDPLESEEIKNLLENFDESRVEMELNTNGVSCCGRWTFRLVEVQQ